MTASLAAALCEPIDADAPCGPDLDLAFDPEYSLFVASAEGILPEESFFTFNRTQNDLAKESRRTEALLQRSRDLRLLVLLAKLRILNRELDGFASAMLAMAALLKDRWETVHPAADDGDFSLRIVVIESLDDMKSVIMPLQHAPLVMTRRIGAVTFRMIQIAQGEVQAREGEPAPDMMAIEAAFADAEMAQLLASRDHIEGSRAALDEMQAAADENGVGSLGLNRLTSALARIATALDGAIVKRDPGAGRQQPSGAEPDMPLDQVGHGQSASPPGPTAAVPLDDAFAISRALLSAELYFRTNEPSSPALLLVAQARQLVGKSLAESVQLLVPNHAGDATINVGGRMVFDLPIERLATLVEAGAEIDPAKDDKQPVAANRREALDILQQVAGHLRIREPSSAIPLLCERARSLAERDFMSLLREMLPDSAFRNLDES